MFLAPRLEEAHARAAPSSMLMRSMSRCYTQYAAYCEFVGTKMNIDASKATSVGFGMGSTISRGTACLTMPIGSIFVSFVIHVVDTYITILLSLADMNKHQLIFLNPFNKVTHLPSGESARVKLKFGHPMITWSRFMKCMFTIRYFIAVSAIHLWISCTTN